MPSWGAKDLCHIIICEAYDNLSKNEKVLTLQITEPPSRSAKPPGHGASGPGRGASTFCTLRIFSTENKASQNHKQSPHRSKLAGNR